MLCDSIWLVKQSNNKLYEVLIPVVHTNTFNRATVDQ